MAPKRSKNRRPNSIDGQFAPRLVEMLESPAWRVLSLSAHRVIDRIEIEHRHHGGRIEENGKLPVTYDDFHKYGIHRHAIGPAIREAVALGFIVITKHGIAGNAEWRSPNLFRLTYQPAKGIPSDGRSHEWRCLTTMEEAELRARNARSASPEKTFSQCRKTTLPSDGNRHRKRPFPVTETITENDPIPSDGNHHYSRYIGVEGGGCGGKTTDKTTDTTVTSGSTVTASSSKILH
jgi:hypothetical protein